MNTTGTSHSLERKLRSVTSAWDRLPLLVQLSEWYGDNDPTRASDPAFEALHVAKSLGDRYWIAQSLYAVGQSMLGQDRFSEVLFYLGQATELFDELGERHRKATADHYRAKTFNEMGNIEQAMRLALGNLNFFEEKREMHWLSRTFLLIASLYRNMGRPVESLQHCRKGLMIVRRHRFTDIAGDFYLHLGLLYQRMEDVDRAEQYLHKYLQMSISNRQKRGMAVASANLASLYLRKNCMNKAREYAVQAQSLYQSLGYPAREAGEFEKLAAIYSREGDGAASLLYYQKAIDILEKTENKLCLAYAYKNIGVEYHHQHRTAVGIRYLLKALNIVDGFDDLYYKYQIYEALALLYEGVRDSDNALKYHKMYVEAKEEYAGAEKQRMLKEEELRYKMMRMRRELRRRQGELTSLKEENGKKEAELLSLALELTHKNEALSKLRSNGSGHYHRQADGEQQSTDWDAFARQFNKVHQAFYFKLVKDFPGLTATEVKICSLIRIGLSSKEISSILCVSKRTVDSHREHIHKKLRLSSRTLLTTFIAGI